MKFKVLLAVLVEPKSKIRDHANVNVKNIWTKLILK
jgi:hypothetical protein